MTSTEGSIYKTTDYGVSWNPVNSGVTKNLYHILFINKSIGWICGAGGLILKTTDGGDSWNTQSSDTHISYLKFIDENNGVGVGAGVFYTTDGGDNWTPFPGILPVEGVSAVSFTDFDNVWIAGTSGAIIKGGGIAGTVGVKEINHNAIPDSYVLSQNYPNPFNPATKIRYTIPSLGYKNISSQRTTLKIYDILGNEVAALVDKEQQPGNYEVEFNPVYLSSGVYFYQLRSGSFIGTKKMVFLK